MGTVHGIARIRHDLVTKPPPKLWICGNHGVHMCQPIVISTCFKLVVPHISDTFVFYLIL